MGTSRSQPNGARCDATATDKPCDLEGDVQHLTAKPARLIVCGGRDFHDYYRLANVMDRLRAIRPIAMVFHGNARGADTLAHRWCVERGVKVFPVPAEWSKHGKRAGPLRNQAMLGHGIDLVLAFPGGSGTEDMVRRAKRAGVMVTRAVAIPGLRPPFPADHNAAVAASLEACAGKEARDEPNPPLSALTEEG